MYNPDECEDWRNEGKSPNSDKVEWEEIWGDGVVSDHEQWDDGNTHNGDGCSYEWLPEFRYKWTGGGYRTSTTWEICLDGFSTNGAHTEWRVNWGDGLKHTDEQWDDNNSQGSDGWSGSWEIEDGFICTGGTLTTADTCSGWTGGTSPNETKDTCIVICGDGLKHSTEGWDDGNTDSFDGCSSTCQIER